MKVALISLVVFDTTFDASKLQQDARSVEQCRDKALLSVSVLSEFFSIAEFEKVTDMMSKAETWSQDVSSNLGTTMSIESYNLWNRVVFMCKKVLGEVEVKS